MLDFKIVLDAFEQKFVTPLFDTVERWTTPKQKVATFKDNMGNDTPSAPTIALNGPQPR